MQRKQSQKRQFQQHRQNAGYTTHPAIARLNNFDTDQGVPEATATAAATLRPTTRRMATTGEAVRDEDVSADSNDIRTEDEGDESGEAADDVALLDCVAHAQANVTIRESSDCVYQQRHHQPQHQHQHQHQHQPQHQQHCQDKLVNLQMGGDVGFRKTTWHAPSANAAGHSETAASAAATAAAASGSTGKNAIKAMKNVCNDERA